jgi:multidrug efflux pump subunit AcrB
MEHTKHSLNIVGSISHFFTVNRPLSALLLLVTIVFGLMAFFLTPKQYNPEIVRPAFSISINYIGATQEEAINRVVYELVEKIITVPGVDDVFTTVTDDAHIQATVIFEVGYDATRAKVDLLSQIQQHEYLARGFIASPEIIEINPETIPVLQIVFASTDVAIQEVRKDVVALSHTLSDVHGVSAVEVIGGYQPTVQIQLHPEVMNAQNISFSQVLQALNQGQSRFVSSGFRTNNQTVSFVFDGRADTITDIGMLPVFGELRIQDVATVYKGASKKRGYVLYETATQDSAEVVVLAVSKVEGSSAPEVTNAVKDAVKYLVQEDPYRHLDYRVVHDDGVTASDEIFGLTKNLITSIAIVVLVLLLFLSFRASVVVFVAIPVTLLIVFGVGYLFGQTINRITLFALILSLGLLVDSAIVVVENIHEHLRRVSKETASATREIIIAGAVHEIGVGLLLSAVTSVIVFLPMRYITGMMGPYMGPIAFFVPTALIVSLLVAIIVTPFVASHILRVSENKNPLSVWVDKGMQKLTLLYQVILRKILYTPVLQKHILLGALGVFFISLLLPITGLVHFQMLPRADRDQLYVYIDAPVDTQTEYTKIIAQDISKLLTDDPEVTSIQQYIAQAPALDFNGMFKGAQNRIYPYQATLRVNITSSDERSDSSSDITARLREKVALEYPGYASWVRFMQEPPGPPVMATVVAKVSSKDSQAQEEFAQTLYSYFVDDEDVIDVYTSTDTKAGRVVYAMNYDKAQIYGVRSYDVQQVLEALSGATFATEYSASDTGEFTPILISFPSSYTDAPSDISQLQVPSLNGSFIPLTSVLDVSYEARPSSIYFEHATPMTYVTAEVQNKPVIYVVVSTIYNLISGNISQYTVTRWGLFSVDIIDADGTEISLHWGGEWEMTLENFRDLGIAMGVALLLVYAVLVAQYNSFSKPAYILVTIPLGLVGILWGFLFLDTFFGVMLTATALIGFIALIGLVVNNAIIFLEYVEQSQAKGRTLEEALLAAGSARLRPIFLTSLTTILGSLTIVNDPVWSGLAWAIIFGLSLSTVLTLLMYPTLLVFFQSRE